MMRRALVLASVLASAGVALAGCSSMSLPSMDFFTPAPPVVTLQLDSRPPGAIAATSAGTSCQTPCAIQIAAVPGLTVTYTLDRHLPQTVALQVIQHQGPPAPDGTAPIVTDFDPNPAVVELQPTTPPRKMRAPPKKRSAAAKPRAAAGAPPPAPPPSSSPFPPPQPQSR